MSTSYHIAIAGTTAHTVMCAEALRQDRRFSIPWVLTPHPKPVGRKQIVTKNPLHQWAEVHNIPVSLVDKKINQEIKSQITTLSSRTPDFLLVVDFGYIVPDWLLAFPTIAPLNIHPSELPKYRGSSPGQFVLLYGEKQSAVTLMKMDAGLDTGPLISQLKFTVSDDWTATEYYQHAFELITKQLPQFIAEFANRERPLQAQPETSPTPIARRLNKEDGFVEWDLIQTLVSSAGTSSTLNQHIGNTSTLLQEIFATTNSWLATIQQAVRGLSPWPGVWTLVPTSKGDKRMKILEIQTLGNSVQLKTVQLEGLQPTSFEQIKNQIL